MAIQYQSPLTPSPTATTVDGPLKLSVDILIVSGNPTELDATYKIEDPANAVHFANGLKEETRTFPVTDAQLPLVNDTELKCGDGKRPAVFKLSISIYSDNVLQAQPRKCDVGVTSYTCPEAAASVDGASLLESHTTPASASTLSTAGGPPRKSARPRASKPRTKRGKGGQGGKK